MIFRASWKDVVPGDLVQSDLIYNEESFFVVAIINVNDPCHPFEVLATLMKDNKIQKFLFYRSERVNKLMHLSPGGISPGIKS